MTVWVMRRPLAWAAGQSKVSVEYPPPAAPSSPGDQRLRGASGTQVPGVARRTLRIGASILPIRARPFRGASMASLIICLDGTWNNADSADNQTNIGLLASMIDPKPERGVPAQIYYDAGVGTSGSRTNRLAGGLLGKGLSTNILEAYRFLSLNYQAGDDIYIFGYSRGAYTARSLCGFLAASGLLRADACDPKMQDFAWKYYRTKPKKRFPADKEHLRRLAHPNVRVRFLGVFDTVGSLGIPRTWLNWIGRRAFQFHDTDLCPIVD